MEAEVRGRYDHSRRVALVALGFIGCGSLELERTPPAPYGSTQSFAQESAADGSIARLKTALRELPAPSDCSPWCRIAPWPAGYSLASVAGTGEDDLWIGDYEGNLVHWDGAALQTLQPGGHGRRSIEVIAPDDVWIEIGTGVAHWDGREFEYYDIPAQHVWRAASGELFVGAFDGSLRVWNGSRFEELASRGKQGVIRWAGTARNDLWTVLDTEKGVWHYDGAAWREVEALRQYRVSHLVTLGPRDVWMLANDAQGTHILHFDGVVWTQVYETKNFLDALFGDATCGVWAFDTAESLRLDGQALRKGPGLPAVADGRCVGGVAHVVGLQGGIYRVTEQPAIGFDVVASNPRMHDVWASARTDVWAVGEGGAAWRFDGTRITPIDTGVDVTLRSVSGTGPDDVWMVGDDGVVLHGSLAHGFQRVSSGTKAQLEVVFADTRGAAWVAGGYTLARVSVGEEPVRVDALSRSWMHDIHGTASDDIWALSNHGLAHFDGRKWAWFSGDPTHGRIWALAKNDLWTANFAGHGTVSYGHWDGSRWERWHAVMEPPAGAWMFQVHLKAGLGRSLATWTLGPDDHWSVTPEDGAVLRRVQPSLPNLQ